MTITGNLECFHYPNFEISFLKNKAFLKNLSTLFSLKCYHTKLPFQKAMLRQIEWGIENEPVTKSGLCY